ncbi:hypothetical protein C1H46_011455 [Malus baccata]|uniref:Uncharacterized protein n=1 Tax=Malus baccata TaxID=106549 RepID=A0A540MW23_MALBA|nr:hypothetical protein C1H46_011455 [Malus baccata]
MSQFQFERGGRCTRRSTKTTLHSLTRTLNSLTLSKRYHSSRLNDMAATTSLISSTISIFFSGETSLFITSANKQTPSPNTSVVYQSPPHLQLPRAVTTHILVQRQHTHTQNNEPEALFPIKQHCKLQNLCRLISAGKSEVSEDAKPSESTVSTIVNLAEKAKMAREGVIKAPNLALLSICKSLIASGVASGVSHTTVAPLE